MQTAGRWFATQLRNKWVRFTEGIWIIRGSQDIDANKLWLLQSCRSPIPDMMLKVRRRKHLHTLPSFRKTPGRLCAIGLHLRPHPIIDTPISASWNESAAVWAWITEEMLACSGPACLNAGPEKHNPVDESTF